MRRAGALVATASLSVHNGKSAIGTLKRAGAAFSLSATMSVMPLQAAAHDVNGAQRVPKDEVAEVTGYDRASIAFGSSGPVIVELKGYREVSLAAKVDGLPSRPQLIVTKTWCSTRSFSSRHPARPPITKPLGTAAKLRCSWGKMPRGSFRGTTIIVSCSTPFPLFSPRARRAPLMATLVARLRPNPLTALSLASWLGKEALQPPVRRRYRDWLR